MADKCKLTGIAHLLPTPRAQQSYDRNSNIWARPEDEPQNLENALARVPAVSALLPTPIAGDGMAGRAYGRNGTQINLPGIVRAMADDETLPDAAANLLPTPRGSDGTNGGPNQRGSSGDLMLPSAVVHLLPTPEAKNAHAGPDYARMKRDGSGGHDLVTAVAYDAVSDTAWGPYEGAVRRWESVTRPAPAPTEPNSKGNPRLSPFFDEWMMGWPLGWVTELMQSGAIGRRDVLRLCGNGVVPQQAAAAIVDLLGRIAGDLAD